MNSCVVNFPFFKKHGLLAVFLMIVVLLVYIIPFRDWRFWLDSYSVGYTGQVKSIHDVRNFFGPKPHNWFNYPSNIRNGTKWSFFNVLYRPLASCLPACIMPWVGPYHQHAIFIYVMLLHALCVALLLFLFLKFLSPISSIIGVLLFAFHPSLGVWVGDFCMQPMHITFLLIGLSILFLKWGLDKDLVWWIVGSVFLFAIALWTHEYVILFPMWLAVVVPFYLLKFLGERRIFMRSMNVVLPFFAVVAVYLLVRFIVYPPINEVDCALVKTGGFLGTLWTRFCHGDFLAVVIDLIGLRWLPHGYRLLKSVLLVGVLGFFVFAVSRSCRWLGACILLFGGALFYWPSFVLPHCSRYAYPVIPFVLGAILYAVDDSKLLRRFTWLLFLWLSLVGCIFNLKVMFAREKKMKLADNALRAFVVEDAADKPILFVGVPADLFPLGMAPGIWMYRGIDKVPIYNDYMISTHCWNYLEREYAYRIPQEDTLDITLKGNMLRLSVNSRDSGVWLIGGEDGVFSLGRRIINDQEMTNFGYRAYDVSFEIDQKWLKDGVNLVSWDFMKQRFKVVNYLEKTK